MAKSFETEWAFDEFSHELSFVARNMFGCRAAYLDGRLVLVLAEDHKEPQWWGALVPTERAHHESLREQFPAMIEHPILGKWLFLPANREEFEDELARISRLIARRDPRIGVVPKPKRRKAKKSKAKTPKRSQRK